MDGTVTRNGLLIGPEGLQSVSARPSNDARPHSLGSPLDFEDQTTSSFIHPDEAELRYESHKNDRESRRSSRSMSSDLELDDVHSAERDGENDEELGEDKRQRGRRRRHTASDGRLRKDVHFDDAGANPTNQTFMEKVVINGILIGLWYIFSISISVYNKWMFSKGNLDFPFPLFTTSLHMVVQFALSSLVLLLIPKFRPRPNFVDSPEPPTPSQQLSETQEPSKPLITPWFYFTRIAPCASATGLDIGLGNTSLRYITLTFFTMCKSSTLGFVLGFAIIFRLEKPSWRLGAIILVMTVGVIMMVAGETAFNTLGFILLMMASFFSGLRWSLTQMLLRRNPATSNPFSSLFFLTPIMFFVLLFIAIPVEGIASLKAGLDDLARDRGHAMGIAIILFPGVLAFLMTSSEFALLKRTSVVTLSVCGIFKEALTIAAAGIIFGDPLSPINISGLFVTVAAIAAYNIIRLKKMKRKADRQAQETTEEHAPLYVADEPLRRMSTGDMIRQSLHLPQPTYSRPPVSDKATKTFASKAA